MTEKVEKQEILLAGKAKRVYRTSVANLYWMEFKDDATAFNGRKKGCIQGKGIINNKISAFFFKLLAKEGISTHFERVVGEREMLVKALQIFPIEVVVRNIAAGSLAKRLGLKEGTGLKRAVIECYYKNDLLGDPLINDDHVDALNLATSEQLEFMKQAARKVNAVLCPFLRNLNIDLADFKLEFGNSQEGILLGDEISPDTCRFWDRRTKEKLDKDRFRQDLGAVEEAYQEVWRRLSECSD